jgi:flagellar P-ring protein precursor FlgI
MSRTRTDLFRSLVALAFIATATLGPAPRAHATRIEDLCDVGGVRPNQLVGYGLVVGLNQSGDRGQDRFTVQSTAAMLRRLGATVDLETIQNIQMRNAAAVMVTATIPSSATAGLRVDVNVASIGNARSLLGGVLLQTPLYGADRRDYAVAQGPVLVGGFVAAGQSGSRVQQNHPTSGRVPDGAIVERRIEGPALGSNGIFLQLRDPSFVTAERIAQAIVTSLGEGTAEAVDHALVKVTVPEAFRTRPVALVAQLALLEVEPDTIARVVVDERTGTVVLGAGVRITEAAVAHGNLTVEIVEQPAVSQPAPLAAGATTTVPQTQVTAESEGGAVALVPNAASLREVVAALNALGARPRDLVPILQALHTAGALRARIESQ